MHLPEYVKRILDVYDAAGYTALVVGGCVRDSLMGLEPDDYDVAVNALPEETKALFPADRIIETGIKHGTLTIMSEGHPVEVTVFRKDGSYTDNRRPSSVTFTRTFADDAARRDFTVNAMGYSPKEGTVDLFGGLDDIKKGIIRAVGDPETRFREDALRIMRAVRFAAKLGFAIEEETERAMFKCKGLLLNISKERLFSELQKTLSGKNCREALLKYADVIGVFCPAILPMKGFEQNNPYHKYDVLTHTAVALSEVKDTPLLKWVTLFHDTGKPLCYTEDERGGHFYGHAKISADIAEKALSELKAPTALKESAVKLISVHDIPLEPTERFVKRQLNRLGEELFLALIDFQRADNAAQNEAVAYRREIFDKVEAIARETLAKRECFSLKDLAVKGNDLIAVGIPKGKLIGRTLDALLEGVLEGRLKNEKETLIKYANNLQNGE